MLKNILNNKTTEILVIFPDKQYRDRADGVSAVIRSTAEFMDKGGGGTRRHNGAHEKSSDGQNYNLKNTKNKQPKMSK